MDRREFLQVGLGAGTGLSLLQFPAMAQPEASLSGGIIPADKGIGAETLALWKQRGERRAYRGPNLYAIGMPVGGICAGQLYVRGDGTLGGWHVDGKLNATGYGSESYRTKRAEMEVANHFSITLDEGASKRLMTLDERGF